MLAKEKFIPRVRISKVYEINISSDDLVQKLLKLSETENICLLDSCGVNHLGSHLLIAGINPLEVSEFNGDNIEKTLSTFNKKLSNNLASIFTISYDFGLKLEKIKQRKKELETFSEPDIFLSSFDLLIIHDYSIEKTYLVGNEHNFTETEKLLLETPSISENTTQSESENIKIASNFTKEEYISKISEIQNFIREGQTYQTNLTQQFRVGLPKQLTPQHIFGNLRQIHPAPFASFIKRKNDFVVSISPERFFALDDAKIITSPIKGTRPRATDIEEDLLLKNELINSKKDRAENTMIVDLLRNDIGRICKFGSVEVKKLCDLESHPTLFHLVSTITGKLNKNINYADIIKAIFPCGSITGCPKISTMRLIDELETVNRGLSMGAIGYAFPTNTLPLPLSTFHSAVAIRTMVIRHQEAIFNVGGGIVIDSNPEDEYKESMLKAKALFAAIGLKDF